jgi:hypothetical protein
MIIVIQIQYSHDFTIPLNYNVLTATRQGVTHIQESRRFESIYIMQEKPDTHDTYASSACPYM